MVHLLHRAVLPEHHAYVPQPVPEIVVVHRRGVVREGDVALPGEQHGERSRLVDGVAAVLRDGEAVAMRGVGQSPRYASGDASALRLRRAPLQPVGYGPEEYRIPITAIQQLIYRNHI